MFTMRFDMRAKDGPATTSALYEAALEISEWGEQNGCVSILVSEHHGSPDGYLPAPVVLASAIAARTKSTPIQVAAVLVPLHDPVSLAEHMAVLDIVSGGRVSWVCAVGYREEEYSMFGRSMKGRGRRMEECLDVIHKCFAGEPFEYEGRTVHATPVPATPGGPALFMGGNSRVAVRRAAKFGMGMLTQGGDPSLETIYREACAEFGTTPADFINPVGESTHSAFVAEDPDQAWAEIGPYLLHDAQMYAAWMGTSSSITKSVASTVDELRAENGNYRIFSVDEAVEQVRENGMIMTQPLSGGIPPELAWPSLELIAGKVIPAARA